MSAVDGLGWAATAIFATSYFCRTQERLRTMQMVAAVLWTVYGISIRASPVIVANVLVLSAAAWTTRRARRARELRSSNFEVRS
jgi:hypothetical protein